MRTDKGSPSLPCDLLSEVLARCAHETLVRCAASSRLLCRCMLDDPAILRRPGACTGAFAPSLLLGAFGRGASEKRFVEAPASDVVPREAIRSFVSDNANLLGRFDERIACRSAGGLVVLRRDAVDLCVCNPMTGQICFLPPSEVNASSVAILIGEDAGSGSAFQFQLLAVDLVCDDQSGFNIRSQVFSSPGSFPAVMLAGAWGPVRRVLDEDGSCFSAAKDPPVVLNRVAHWLNTWSSAPYDYHVFALDVDEGCAGRIELPGELTQPIALLLASTPDRRLSILVVEEQVISDPDFLS